MCVSGGGVLVWEGLLIHVSVRMIPVQTSERLWVLKRKGKAALRLISAGMWAEPRQDVMAGVPGRGSDGGRNWANTAGPSPPVST